MGRPANRATAPRAEGNEDREPGGVAGQPDDQAAGHTGPAGPAEAAHLAARSAPRVGPLATTATSAVLDARQLDLGWTGTAFPLAGVGVLLSGAAFAFFVRQQAIRSRPQVPNAVAGRFVGY